MSTPVSFAQTRESPNKTQRHLCKQTQPNVHVSFSLRSFRNRTGSRKHTHIQKDKDKSQRMWQTNIQYVMIDDRAHTVRLLAHCLSVHVYCSSLFSRLYHLF